MKFIRNVKAYILFIILILICTYTNAQIPTFSISVNNNTATSACVGSTVQFTNTSTNQNDVFYWIIEGTKITSATNSTIYVFKGAGTFPIQLIDSSKGTTATVQFIVHDLPIASFNVSNSEICQGNTVTFTSTSTSTATILSYNWNFGDAAQVTTSENTSYIFNKTGNKSTSLFVQDANGCTSLSSSIKNIKVNGSDAISFTANGTTFYSCDNTINFVNTSTVSNAVYTWDFGDGTTSTSNSPGNHTYASGGIYSVSLSANISGNESCIPKIINKVYVGKPTIGIDLSSTLCSNTTYKLIATSTTNGLFSSKSDYSWVFPSGSTINSDSTTISFSKSGNYNLTITNNLGCPNPTQQAVTVQATPTLNLTITPTNGICTSIPVTFSIENAESSNKYKFNFGDGEIDSSAGSIKTHRYTEGGNFTSNVSVTNSNGCSTSKSTTLAISTSCIDNGVGSLYNNVFGFNSLCDSKYHVTFYNKDLTKPFKSIIIDGATHSFTGNTFTIDLTPKENKGTYSVQIIFADGSLDIIRDIQIMDETADFTFINNDNSSKYCAQNKFTFAVDSTINQANISNYSWTITDTQTKNIIYQNEGSNLSSFSIIIPDASTYEVNLTIEDKRATPCVSSMSKTFTSTGIVGDFKALGDSIFCTPTGEVSIKNNSNYKDNTVSSITWNWGDGTTSKYTSINDQEILQHTYDYKGNSSVVNYNVTLQITDASGCTSNAIRNNIFKLYNGQVNFTTKDTILCSTKKIDIQNTSNISDLKANGFIWTVGNNNQTKSNFSDYIQDIENIAFPTTYDVSLIANYGSDINCSTQITKKSYINFIKPIAKFNIINDDAIYTCPPYTLQLQNESSGYQDLTWVFNDTTTNTSTLDTLLYSVSSPNDYKIYLHLNGYDGCSDSTTFSFKAKGPRGKLENKSFVGCMPLNTTLTLNSTDGIVNYLWNMNDGNSYNQASPNSINYTYKNGGTYRPTVTILGRPEDGSCTNTISLDSNIIVDKRISLAYQPDYTFCLGDTAKEQGLKLEVTYKMPTTLTWSSDPTDINNAISDKKDSIIYVKPLQSTVYNVNAKSLNTCPDENGSITVTTRESPIISFPTNSISIAAGEYFYLNPNVTDFSNNLQYVWTPNFRLSNPYIANPQVISDIDTIYTLTLQNEYGCSSSDSIHVKVLCSQSKLLMANAFTPNGDGKNDRFYVSGFGISKVKHFIIFDRWGKKVFERSNIAANDINQGWDGNFNDKQAEPGTYLYIAEVTCTEGTDYNLKGSVVLIR